MVANAARLTDHQIGRCQAGVEHGLAVFEAAPSTMGGGKIAGLTGPGVALCSHMTRLQGAWLEWFNEQ